MVGPRSQEWLDPTLLDPYPQVVQDRPLGPWPSVIHCGGGQLTDMVIDLDLTEAAPRVPTHLGEHLTSSARP